MSRLSLLAALLHLLTAASVEGAPPVTLETGDSIRLSNEQVHLTISNQGRLTELSYRDGPDLAQSGYWNCNANGYDADGARISPRFHTPQGRFRVVRQSNDLVEVAFDRQPRLPLPFRSSLHYVLRRGDPGFYLYMTLAHDAHMPSGHVVQYAYNLRLDPERFEYIAVDDTRRHISHSCRQEAAADAIMDATFRLTTDPETTDDTPADVRGSAPGIGTVVSKYNYTHAIEDDAYHLYGWAGPEAGVWWIQPSAEYYSSAPFRLLLTSHQTAKSPVLIWQAQCTHRGGYTIDFPPTDTAEWAKLYGPVFVYLNQGDDYDAMWNDAKARVETQRAAWPYPWMQHQLFPIDRGSVSGRLAFENDQPAANAWVILAPAETHWSTDNRGYHFWTRTNDDGHFRIENVRPGRYALTAAGADQFYEFRTDDVQVAGHSHTDLGTTTWNRVRHGKQIWQIGTADRSTGEFANGRDFHHWGTWRRYPADFPEDVHFVIGTSREATHWNFIHWNWYSKRNAWTIEFDLDQLPQGTAVLTFGIAAARGHGQNGFGSRGDASLRVLVGDVEIGTITTPSTGADSYRSQRQSTRYSVHEIRFDAGVLRKGRNVVTLRHTRADPYQQDEPKGEQGAGPGCIMYDAIRLEIE